MVPNPVYPEPQPQSNRAFFLIGGPVIAALVIAAAVVIPNMNRSGDDIPTTVPASSVATPPPAERDHASPGIAPPRQRFNWNAVGVVPKRGVTKQQAERDIVGCMMSNPAAEPGSPARKECLYNTGNWEIKR